MCKNSLQFAKQILKIYYIYKKYVDAKTMALSGFYNLIPLNETFPTSFFLYVTISFVGEGDCFAVR